MQHKVNVRYCEMNDINEVANLYKISFSSHWKSRLGLKACQQYLYSVYKNSSHKIVILENERNLIGFAIFHLDKYSQISRKWIIKVGYLLPLLFLKNPLAITRYFFKLLNQRVCQIYRSDSNSNLLDNGTNRIREDGSAYLDFIGIDSGFQSLGYGKLLLVECIELVKCFNKNRLYLSVNKNNFRAIRTYESLGFIRFTPDDSSNSLVYFYEI